jgi:cellobiose-specific phosphotransferase system component IIC
MAEAKITATLYDEPAILEILVLSSFVLVLNIVNFVFDNAIYCGLIGQILVGVAWGTPGGKLLDADMENIMVQLGYLGLMLLVYEGQ